MDTGGIAMSDSCCCGCLPTPDSILEDDEIDVFEQIIPNTDYQYQEKRNVLWSAYRYRGIGNCNYAYWLQAMKDRYAMIKDTWDQKFKAWHKFLTDQTAVSFEDSSSEYSQDTTTENEDMPDNPAGSTVYLSDRSRSKTSYQGKGFSGLASQTARDYIDAIPDPYEGFADEFRKLFYWGL